MSGFSRWWLPASVLVALQIGLFGAMRAGDGDPFDGSLYWWTWLILPLVAAAFGWRFPDAPPVLWTLALVVPMVLQIAWLGTVLHGPDEGASLWMVGEIFALVQAVPIQFGAWLGAAKGGRPTP